MANPDPEVRSNRRVHYAALHPSAGPDLQIRIRHWTDAHCIRGCVGCMGRFAEVRNLVAQAGIEKRLLGFPARSLVFVYATLSRLPLKVNGRKLQQSSRVLYIEKVVRRTY